MYVCIIFKIVNYKLKKIYIINFFILKVLHNYFKKIIMQQYHKTLKYLTDSPFLLFQRDQYHLRAIALDKGIPQHRATVEVIIDVVDRANNPPIWDQPVYGPIFIKENYMVGQVVASIKAR